MTEVSYREGKMEDLAELQALGLASYGQYAERLGPGNWKQMETSLQRINMYEDLLKTAKSFVCTDKEKIVGMAYLLPKGNPNEIYPAGWSYIRMVGVYPEYSGRGIAKKLTAMCIDYAKASGEDCVALHTSEIMDAARHIYESLGFRVVRELPKRYGIRYWLYRLDLRAESTCTRCSATFHCGAKDNEPCWCCALPNIVPVNAASCLCPACLEAEIKSLQSKA